MTDQLVVNSKYGWKNYLAHSLHFMLMVDAENRLSQDPEEGYKVYQEMAEPSQMLHLSNYI